MLLGWGWNFFGIFVGCFDYVYICGVDVGWYLICVKRVNCGWLGFRVVFG